MQLLHLRLEYLSRYRLYHKTNHSILYPAGKYIRSAVRHLGNVFLRSTFSWQRRKYISKPVSCCRCYFGSQPQLIVWANYRPGSSGDPPSLQGWHPQLARACGLPVQPEQPRELFLVGLPTRRPGLSFMPPASSFILNYSPPLSDLFSSSHPLLSPV